MNETRKTDWVTISIPPRDGTRSAYDNQAAAALKIEERQALWLLENG